MKKTVIGIIGTISSGKDTVADYISKKLEIPVFQTSQQLKDIAQERGLDLKRANLIKLGTKIAIEKGPDYLVKMIVESSDEERIVITGMRDLGHIEYLRAHTKLVLVALEADAEIRFHRTQDRGRAGEAETVEEFVENEEVENSGEHTQRLFECLKLADYTIANNKGLDSLYKKIDDVLVREKLEHLNETQNEFKQRPR